MPGVKSVPNQRRLNTETYVYCLNGSDNGKFIIFVIFLQGAIKYLIVIYVNI